MQRNFQGYATQADCDLIALGVSAISRIGKTYAQNHRLLQDYYEALDRSELPLSKGLTMTNDDEIRRAAIHDLLCQSEITITPRGRFLGRIIAMSFDRYLREAKTHGHYSKVI